MMNKYQKTQYPIDNVYNSYIIKEDFCILLITMIIDCIQKLNFDLDKKGLIKKSTILTKSVLYRIPAEKSTVHQMMYPFIYKTS